MTQAPHLTDPRTLALYEARTQIVKALAHPSRLFIVDVLQKGERCVCELTDMIGADISTVSKHLSLLKNAGIVADEKRGSQVFYSLRTPCILNFFLCIETVLHDNIRQQAELVSLASGRSESTDV